MPPLKDFLDELVERYNRPDFIADDPISLPHRFSLRQDIEIIGFWVAVLAWGQRKQIIRSGEKLLELMEQSPYDFVKNHQAQDRARFERFVHRTFQPEDAIFFLEVLQGFYQKYDSLEEVFVADFEAEAPHIETALISFERHFFEQPWVLARSRKHLPSPLRGSSCKRLCMFLRWMVRQDDKGVDFGLWTKIKAAQLLPPLDVHVERQARRLGLLQRPKSDWKAVLELGEQLRLLDPQDPVRYDFALFGLGIESKSGTTW